MNDKALFKRGRLHNARYDGFILPAGLREDPSALEFRFACTDDDAPVFFEGEDGTDGDGAFQSFF